MARRELQPGETLLLCYGELNNDELLLEYGFVLSDNPHDFVVLDGTRQLFETVPAVKSRQPTLLKHQLAFCELDF